MAEARKTYALLFFLSVTAVGLFSLLAFFFSSMTPSARAKAQRYSHDVSTLMPGDFLLQSLPGKSAAGLGEYYLILREFDTSLHIYLLPMQNGYIQLPRRSSADNWWSAGFDRYCEHFSPDVNSNGQLEKNGEIRCQDAMPPELSARQPRWRTSGESVSGQYPDLMSVDFEILGRHAYFNGFKW